MNSKTYIFVLCFSCMSMIVLMGMNLGDSRYHLFKSAGAPAGSTGAPLEGSCGDPGCHFSNQGVNSGPGIISLALAGGDSTYQPNLDYQVNVALNQSNVEKFGFQALVLKDRDTSNIGQISLTNAIRTQEVQVLDSNSQVFGRNYITHTLDGNIAQTLGWGEWSFNWTAPSAGNGRITVYLAALAADNNGNAVGDDVYVTSLTLNEDTVSVLSSSIIKNNESVIIGPSPFTNQLNVEILNPLPAIDYLLEIIDLEGRLVLVKFIERAALISRNNIPAGVYFVKITNKHDFIFVKKILVN